MPVKIEGVSREIEGEVNALIDHLQNEFGCTSELSEEFPCSEICIVLTVTMPKNKKIFLPASKKVRVFSIDTNHQVMTLMYFPDANESSNITA